MSKNGDLEILDLAAARRELASARSDHAHAEAVIAGQPGKDQDDQDIIKT